MNSKKIISVVSVLALTATMLTACGSNGGAQTSETTTASETVTTTESVTTASETEEATPDSEPEAPAEEANPLQPLVDATLTAGEWPALMEVTDTQIIGDYFTIDVTDSNFEQYIFMQCPMSANLSELIIIKATDPEAAKTALEGRQKKAQETDAFYPNDVERAGASIVGVNGSYAYFIMVDSASDAETALNDAINAL